VRRYSVDSAFSFIPFTNSGEAAMLLHKSAARACISAVALAALAVSAIGADDATPKVSVTVQDGDTLVIKVPAGWDRTQTHASNAPTITMHPKNQEAELKITFIADPKGELGKKDHLEKAVRAAAQQYVKGSVEKQINFKASSQRMEPVYMRNSRTLPWSENNHLLANTTSWPRV
jgi:hypothetical protein